MGKRKTIPGAVPLLWDSHRAPHGPTAAGWRDTQESPDALPVHSQPLGSVTGTRTSLDKCPRESGETTELPKARLCKCLAQALSHHEGQDHLCHLSRRNRRDRLSQEAPTSHLIYHSQSKRDAEQVRSLLQKARGGSLRARGERGGKSSKMLQIQKLKGEGGLCVL